MSRAAALALKADAGSRGSGHVPAGLRVSKPGDAHEMEADRVADTVVHGGRVSGWSLSESSDGTVLRDEAKDGTSSLADVAGKVAQAVLATPTGKQAVEAVTNELTTPAGLALTGAAAIGVVTGLAKAKKPLPAQLPAIPLDFIKPGLSAKLDYQGPVNSPTAASITLSFTPKAAHGPKGPSATERTREDTARIAADQAKFRAGMTVKGDGAQGAGERTFEEDQRQQMLKRMGGLLQMPSAKPAAGDAKTPGANGSGGVTPAPAKLEPPKVKAGAGASSAPAVKTQGQSTPTLELKPAPGVKDEMFSVQRKAATDAAPETTGVADVDSVVRSPGRPLDGSTRRDMESSLGYDFSKVRVHTDARAADSAQDLSAHAYTVGSSVVFASGQYAPESTKGRRLLAHELTHVVQQTSTPAQARAGVHAAPKMVQRHWWDDLYDDAKEWVLNKIRNSRGYPLFCAIIGKDLFSGQPVERSASNFLKGVLNLFEAGQAIWEKLVAVKNAIQTAYDWLVKRVDQLGLNLDYFEGLLGRIYDAIEWKHPRDSWDRVVDILEEPIDKLLTLAADIGRKVLDFIFQAALSVFGDAGRKVYEFLQKAGAVFMKIFGHPIEFAKNLFKAIVDGFTNFGKNILDHLKAGLKEWIFDELHVKGVTMPEDFSLKSMFKLLLQVLGLTYDRKRPLLVEKLGEPAVYFFETSGKVLARVQKEGFSAIKDMIAEQAGSIYDSLVNSLKNWVAKEIVTRGVAMIAELSNPLGELIEAVRSIYEMVMFVIEKAQKLGELIKSVVDALGDIADGNTGPAAQKVEDSLARTIPLVLAFIAGQLHLSGIGKSIREIIDKIRAPIDNVIGKVLDFIVDKAKGLWASAKEGFTQKLQDLKDWWSKPEPFDYGDEPHTLEIEGEGDKPEVYVHSDKIRLRDFLRDHKVPVAKQKPILDLAKGLSWKKGKLESTAKSEAGYTNYKKLRDLMAQLKSKFPKMSVIKDNKPVHSTYGAGVSAEAFLSDQLPTGSAPSYGNEPVAWTDLGYLLDEKHYIRGHLINDNLGGHGDTWTNLTPLTKGANKRMLDAVEQPLKDALADPGNTSRYHYEVNVSYTRRVISTAKTAKQQADVAESRLTGLSWRVKDAEVDDNGNWKITREKPTRGKSPLPDSVVQGSVDPTVPGES